jgi:hypothetical protein
MKTRSKIGIFVVIIVALGILALFAYTWQIESARAGAIREDMIDCIEAYGSSTPCAEICEGTLEDSRYLKYRTIQVN